MLVVKFQGDQWLGLIVVGDAWFEWIQVQQCELCDLVIYTERTTKERDELTTITNDKVLFGAR